jgi:hypothetical protein
VQRRRPFVVNHPARFEPKIRRNQGKKTCAFCLLLHQRRALVENGAYLAQGIKGSSHHRGDLDHPIGPLLYKLQLSPLCTGCWTGAASALR